MLDIFLIAVIVVCIVDISGFTYSWKSALKKILTDGKMSDPFYSFKPFDCSLCMTTWIGLLYLIITGQFTIPMLAYLMIISVMTTPIKDGIYLGREIMLKIIKKIYEAV